MTSNSTNSAALQSPAEAAIPLLDDWFDPIEAGRRDRVRGFIQGMIEAELEAALSRRRYARRPAAAPENADGASGVTGHGMATDRGRCWGPSGGSRSRCRGPGSPPRRARQPSGRARRCGPTSGEPSRPISPIAGAYLAGTNTRRVRRALSAVFGGAGRQGYGEPGLAEGESRLGRLEWPLARRGADRPRDPRRHRGAGPARSEGPPRSCCWSCSACVRSARSCCWPSRTWGARPARRSAPSSTISSGAGCVSRTSWWSTAGPGCSRRWPHSGATCRPNAARSTSTATCWPMLPNAGMRRFRPTIPT